jgi:putative membrane protein
MTVESQPPHPLHPALPSDLGTLRTVMAADRTLMAWVRTSLSMLSFGFTIYKFLETAAQHEELARPHSPQYVGLLLAGVGTLSMVLGVMSYWATLKDLRRTEEFRLGRPTLMISVIMMLSGVVLFVGIAARVV